MFRKTVTAAALTLGMATAAFAQAAGGTGDAMNPTVPGAGTPPGWDQTLTDAFFSDPSAGTLRSQEEIQANWTVLSDEQQAQVRSDCATMSADAGATDGTTTGSTTEGAAGTAPAAPMAAMTDLCSWVEGQ